MGSFWIPSEICDKLDLRSPSCFVGIYPAWDCNCTFLVCASTLVFGDEWCAFEWFMQYCYYNFHYCYFTSSNVLCDLVNDCSAILHHYGK